MDKVKRLLKILLILAVARNAVKFVYKNFILPRKYSLKMTSNEIAKAKLNFPTPADVWWFPVIGHLLEVISKRSIQSQDESIAERNQKFREANKNGVSTKVGYEGFQFEVMGEQWVILLNPEDIKYITQTNFQNYSVGETRKTVLHDFLGVGIFTSDDDFWKAQRNKAKPSFINPKLEAMLSVFIHHGDQLLRLIDQQAQKNQSIEVQSLFLSYTLDCSGEILFDHPVGSLHGKIPFQQAFDYLQVEIEKQISIPILRFLPHPTYRKALQVCNEFVSQIIVKAKSDPKLEERNDLLAQFMTSVGENGEPKINDEKYLRDMLMNFLIAGRDTTATTLTWLFYELSMNPRVQDKVYAEITSLFPTAVPNTLDEIRSLKYLKDTVNEALRLHPPVPKVLRSSRADDVLPSGYKVNAGTNIIYDTYSFHRYEEIWGPDALVFDPDRWSDERTKSIGSYEFLPFHGGPRRCLGFDLAYNEVKMATAMILKKYRIEIDKSHEVTAYGAIILSAQNGVKIFFTPRN